MICIEIDKTLESNINTCLPIEETTNKIKSSNLTIFNYIHKM